MRVAVGGLRHETNTFAPSKADAEAFSTRSAEPSPLEGADLLERLRGANIPVQGALDALAALGHQAVPLLWAAASPSAHVTEDAFERLIGRLVQTLRQALPVDGVLLDLHGAMVCEHLDDGEGEILRRVRAVVGPDVPIAVSLDLHANVTRQMVELADVITIFRTYPHVDSAETGARAARWLDHMLRSGRRLHKRHVAFDYLTSLPSQCTLVEPAAGLYAQLQALEAASPSLSLDWAMGFAMADTPEAGMALVVYGEDAGQTERVCAQMAQAIAAAEARFALQVWPAEQAIAQARARGRVGAPVVLADAQDNPGAGGDGDTTGLLQALVDLAPPHAVLGLLIDPDAAAQAHALGAGAVAEFALGARTSPMSPPPVRGRFVVRQLGDGKVDCTGPMFAGWKLQLGPMACLQHLDSGVQVVLASNKFQAADQALLRHVGVEPQAQALLALKSSVHFRNDFQALASDILIVQSPGPCTLDPVALPWQRLRPHVRLRPLGPTLAELGQGRAG
jgi:microcystin degradation protein MlrC